MAGYSPSTIAPGLRGAQGVFTESWKDFFFPRVEAGQAVLPADFPDIPVFQWQEQPQQALHQQAVRAVWQLAIPILLLLGLTLSRIRRYRVV